MAKQVFMDIHTHIIPGVDDGSDSMKETMKMIKQAYDEDIRVIIATPHYGLVNPDYDPVETERLLGEVRSAVRDKYQDLHIVMGNEIYYTPGVTEEIVSGRAKTIGGTSYALVEFNTGVEYETILRAIDEFTLNGYRMIIAHVERYSCLENDVAAVKELISRGAYIQVNCRSLLGGRRKSGFSLENRAAWCKKLLKEDCVHFLASDCHSSGVRRPMIKQALDAVRKITDAATVREITRDNILHLMRDERI